MLLGRSPGHADDTVIASAQNLFAD